MPCTRREILRAAAAALVGAAAPVRHVAQLRPAWAAPAPEIPGWPRFFQPHIGIAFQHPPRWTVRILENGHAGVSEGPDGLSGARAYGELFGVKEGTSSGTLVFTLATNLGLIIDGFRVVEAVRLSAKPDLSALRFTFPHVDGLHKGTLTVEVNKGGAVLLGFDAPAQAYAAYVETLTTVVGTFRWFESSLKLEEATEPRERAYTVMIPGGWRPDLRVIRPAVDAGFVARVTDPAGRINAEMHRPRTPGFVTPHQSFPIAEGNWYHLGAKWGMEPLLVYRYLPGKEYIRTFLLPILQRDRPGAQLVGWADRPDLALTPEVAIVRKALGGSGAGGEAEYAWTKADGTRMRGRAVALTIHSPNPGGRGPGMWHVPWVVLAEAPERDFNTAVAAMITMNASFRLNARWYAAEVKGSRDRWRIIRETEKILFTKYQEAIQYRQDVMLQAAEKWDLYIRVGGGVGRSDYGGYVPYGKDTILTSDGRIIPVIELGGRTVAQWMKENPDGYLKKAW